MVYTAPMKEFATILFAAIAAGFGGYVGAYLKKKGENLATHEDLDKLVVQLEATTEATKRIEAKISNELWDRQRQWEMKQHALLEGARAIADFLASIQKLDAVCATRSGASESADAQYLNALDRRTTDALDAANNASTTFKRAQLIVAIVCGKETRSAFLKIERVYNNIALKIVEGDTEFLEETIPKLQEIGSELTLAIRRELGFNE